MSNKVQVVPEIGPQEQALLLNDLSKLNPENRAELYTKVCDSLGLNPLTQPFSYIQLNGKLTLYAQRNCTDQLRKIHSVSVEIKSREQREDLYIVTALASLPGGRKDESIGAVTLTNLKGDAKANAIMKCETKAKRRVTLSICGLSFLDETEVETIKDAKIIEPVKITEHKKEPLAPPQIDTSEELPAWDSDNSLDASNNRPHYVTFGKYKGKRLDEIEPSELKQYCDYIEDRARAENKPIQGQVFEFMYNARHYIRHYI